MLSRASKGGKVPEKIIKALVILLFMTRIASAEAYAPFFLSGDGCLYFQKAKGVEKQCFMSPDGGINDVGLKRINQIFGAHYGDGVRSQNMSLRFLTFLSFLQGHYDRAPIKLLSGFRPPKYNQSLRDKGRLAAQTSMHIEGAAADIILAGVPSSEVYAFVKSLNCCGVGYYHGNAVHVDTGPARYWDETTSGTESKEPQLNEKIIVQSTFDRYYPGSDIVFQLMRVTNYPVDMPVKWFLVHENDGKLYPIIVQDELAGEVVKGCRLIPNRVAARQILAAIPETVPAGKYHATLKFCSRISDKMPESIDSNVIEVLE
ncbi:MAG: hypothetical protein COV45_01730 [Deltaproteobacteria bacterium CG11_big_fil_rev_8_21_14_0_20_47_16]|nr:MAG: hypothetical protein COV45_01730 [Deltaproteobacteria bacterium CG11_big_fil_rev_8_21_14_0_20_47_16]